MKQELKARIGRLGQTQDIDRISSGSPVDLVIRPAGALSKVKTISAIEAVVRRGATVLKAKRALEVMMDTGEAVVHVPTVEDFSALAVELCKTGVAGTRLASAPVDIKALRSRLGHTQEQFALRFGLDVDAVQNWEQGRCKPDKATASYLRAIAQRPREIAEALEEDLA